MEADKFQSTLPVWEETILSIPLMIYLPFQSTLPVWEETGLAEDETREQSISIHSPRVGRDLTAILPSKERLNFNPLSPCGKRPSGF